MTVNIRRIEEFTLSAWPAPGEVLLDGWLVRFGGGYTRRANCVNPLYAGATHVTAKLETCERLYARAGLAATFKLTDASEPAGLEHHLRERGYHDDSGASVQLLDVGRILAIPAPARVTFHQWDHPADEWVDGFMALNGVAERNRPHLLAIVSAIIPVRRFLAALAGDQIIACGLGVAMPPFVGLFDIVTHVDWRRRGLGQAVVADLLAWGRGQGATTGVLQVVPENVPAVALYASLGFREAYRYRYVVKNVAPPGV